MKTFTYEPTADPRLFRVVDREGNWQRYVLDPRKPEQAFLRGVTTVLGAGYPKGQGFYEYLKNNTADEIERKLKAAGERGDRVHQFIARYLAGEKLDRFAKVRDDSGNQTPLANDEWDAILAFGEFWTRHDCALIAHELAVYETRFAGGYAGTVDVILRMRKDCGNRYCACKPFVGKVGLLDWKSGKGLYPDYAAQVAAYWMAESLPAHLGGGKVEYTGLVHLASKKVSTGGYDFQGFDHEATLANLDDFAAASRLSAKYLTDFDPARDIAEIPDQLGFAVAKDELPAPKATRKPAKGKRKVATSTKKNVHA